MNKTPSPLTLVAIIKAVPGQENTLRAAQEKLVAESVKEPGCLRYELHQSIEDPRVLVFMESWTTEQDWKNHIEGAAIKNFQASGAPKLFAEFSVHQMRLVTDGGRN